MTESDFSSVQEALDHIQGAVGFVRRELRRGGDHDTICDLVSALDAISEALRDAQIRRQLPGGAHRLTCRLDCYTLVPIQDGRAVAARVLHPLLGRAPPGRWPTTGARPPAHVAHPS